jgi:hypothetical protein
VALRPAEWELEVVRTEVFGTAVSGCGGTPPVAVRVIVAEAVCPGDNVVPGAGGGPEVAVQAAHQSSRGGTTA